MTTIGDISQVLGDFMLKGWVLTDQTCPTPGCTVPMLRSPKGKLPITTFCAKCSQESPPAVATTSSDVSSASHPSRSSTPPTEEDSDYHAFQMPPESEETRRRREQSDRASSLIGQKLLQGWTLLGDECPDEGCFGVPLVRPPRLVGDIEPKKQCVICENTYGTERGESAGHNSTYENTRSTVVKTAEVTSSSQPYRSPSAASPPFNVQPISNNQPLPRLSVYQTPLIENQTIDSSLDNTVRSLQAALQSLSARLDVLSTSSHLDSREIGITADSITKTTQALAEVRQLQHIEGRTRPTT